MDSQDRLNTNIPATYHLPQNEDNHSTTDPLWTVDDVAQYLKLQPETIRSMARRGELPALKLGKVWRFQKHTIHNLTKLD